MTDAVSLVERKFEDNDVCLIVDIDEGLESIKGHGPRLTKMLVEVLDRALVGAKQSENRWVCLCVENYGETIEFMVADSREYCLLNYEVKDYPTLETEYFWSRYVEMVSDIHGGKVYHKYEGIVSAVVIQIKASLDKEFIFAA